ncbi:hypothetical protein Taro_024527 [Colocasia esculenta]|uniref:Bifunctional inhibitor/plant lipid transfer protein/seed storage helical domain-containing protein n=1 Tax=Colocasia esculenta TaxID=4460 RepID=A0A843VKL9_COLES|nr:hypothetical protein [Colocasia esculenta]
MASSPALCVVLLLLTSTWACVALAQDGGGGGAAAMTCVKKLLPCQAFLQEPGQTPSPTCCVPLTEALQTETQCLCSVFNNEALLKSFNVTRDAALQLLKNCKATVDLNVCNSTTNGTYHTLRFL